MKAFDAARSIVATLGARGFQAYLAGGCVRDRLLGLEPKDYDVATNATPDEVTALFRGAFLVGEKFGVAVVRRGGHAVEVATFRCDGSYSDGRRPDAVVYSTAEDDARRRDFTMNGLFEDPATGAVIDYVGGRADLAAGIVRAIGDPEARIHEDELRMLRGVRFAARFGFSLDDRTANAIRRHGGSLRGVSRERIGQEIQWMLERDTRAAAARLLRELGLDDVVLERPAEPGRDRLDRLAAIPAGATYPLSLAAWARDRHGTGPLDAVVGGWRESLVLSNGVRDRLATLLAIEERLAGEWRTLKTAARKRLASEPAFVEALDLLAAADAGRAAEVRAEVERLSVGGLAPLRLLDGHALLVLGMEPGPRFGRVLEEVYDAQLDGTIRTPDDARRLARELMARG